MNTEGRIALLVVCSIGGGAVIGAISGLAVAPIAAPFGLLVGGVVGTVLSPVLAIALRRKPLHSLLIVFPPALLVGGAAGLGGSPFFTLLAIVVFCFMILLAAATLPDITRSVGRGSCPGCGYLLGGLERCPECGKEARSERDSSEYPTSVRVLVACVIGIPGFLVPLTFATYLAYERHRPRSTEEWIERLGDNDMQIQWEARQALKTRGTAPLIEALEHPKPGVRANAAWTLQEIGDPKARKALTRLLEDKDRFVRDRAKSALETIPIQ